MYNINGRKYELKPLTLGQLEMLIDLFRDLNGKELTPVSLIFELGTNITKFLAIILTEDGAKDVRENFDRKLNDIQTITDIDLVERIVTDFFVQTKTFSQLQKMIQSILNAVATASEQAVNPETTK